MPTEPTPLKCPVCEGPMQRFKITRAGKGDMQGIKCPICKTSSFLSREALERLRTRSNALRPTRSISEPSAQLKQPAPPVELPSSQKRVPKTLYERWRDREL